MKDSKINTNKVKINTFVYITIFFLFSVFILALCYRTLVDSRVGNIRLSQFIANRNINQEVLLPDRGTIYDSKGNVLAQDVSSYTLIAYLDENRTTDKDKPRHVIDKENTAKLLSEKIDTSYERILELLNKDSYQVEFGPGGKNLSQLEMEAIKRLNLPGIDFVKSTKRYYPNGDFASYLLGYTKNKEDKDGNVWKVGELGIEKYFNEELTGTSGYLKYEKDGRGNIIANSNEYKEEAINGANITLTIDNSVQLFVENAIKKAQEDSNAEWITLSVMNAKTGAILAYSSTPSFDPNIRNITNYLDPLVKNQYEPGSTMKTFSYMCAIESGNYIGTNTFKSGSKTYVSQRNENDVVTIKDWNGTGWGDISFDKGYALSSNIGVATLLDEVITKKDLKECYDKYGFGKITDVFNSDSLSSDKQKNRQSIVNELAGNIKFNYDVEAATAGYGQGIFVTPIQMLQALTSISNNGVMLKPYIVSSVNSDSGEIIEKNGREELRKVASVETIEKIKSLMKSVIVPDSNQGTGYAYYMDGYDLIGKTGTASIFDPKQNKYLTGNSDYIYSFSGLYPADEPELIIYMAVKKPQTSQNYIAPAVKDIVVNLAKYFKLNEVSTDDEKVEIEDYTNKTTLDVSTKLEKKGIKTIILGTGNKIVSQYPNANINLYTGDKLYILTNNYDLKMINFIGLSYKDANEILKMMNVDYQLDGYGYVVSQNIEVDKIINEKVVLKLERKYN